MATKMQLKDTWRSVTDYPGFQFILFYKLLNSAAPVTKNLAFINLGVVDFDAADLQDGNIQN